ncbi:hypothetical protein CcrBL47_gp217c [Caulobacter phage BL47]|nr:hypothetical protein CcrBL47_gp217c [Caulobacter phage BL47]
MKRRLLNPEPLSGQLDRGHGRNHDVVVVRSIDIYQCWPSEP